MALVLPLVKVDRRKRLIATTRDDVLSKADRGLLLNLDWDLARDDAIVGDRVLPLPDDRWAVGRGVPHGTVYRVVELPDLATLRHPAWLWNEDDWFKTQRESGPAPRTVTLKRTLRQAARLVQSTRKVTRLVAATIAHLRRPERRPLAIVTDDAHLRGPGQGARWFSLALLSCIPPQLGLTLRIGCAEPRPDPRLWDIVLTTERPKGFDVVEAHKPPEDLDDDVVAWYIRKRLTQGEPELVEAIATLWDESAEDPWGACLERQFAQEGPAAISLDREALQEQFPVAHRITLARIRGGARITGRLANELAAVTAKSSDPDLWRPLLTYSDRERARAFSAWLAIANRYPPDDALLEVIAAARPAHAQPVAWMSSLLRWLAMGKAPLAAAHLLQQALEEDPDHPDLASRASVFMELVVALLDAGRPVDAMSALFSPAAQHLADQGAGRTLAQVWLQLPTSYRTDAALDDLVGLLGRYDDRGLAAWFLWRGQLAQGLEARADATLERWAILRCAHPPEGPDALIDQVGGTPLAERWVRTIAAHAPHPHLQILLQPAIAARDAKLWDLAEQEWTRTHNPIPRDRFVGLGAFLPDGAAVLEERALVVLEETLSTANFPDPEVAMVASLFAEAPRPSSVWMWTAVAASEPDQFKPATIDATVHAFCGTPPRRPDDRRLGLSVARRLGFASMWSPLEHARWLVRMILAPDGDASGYNRALGLAMLQSMLNRADGLDRVIAIAKALFDLPPDHEALRFFIEDVLPRLWREGPPEAFMRAVQVHKQPTEIRSAWRQAFGHL